MNESRMQHAGSATALAALAVLMTSSLFAPAQAQRPTLTQDTDDIARAPYQEGVTASCNFQGDCAMLFSPVAAGRRRIVEYLSCLVQLTSAGSVQTLSLNATSFRNARAFFPVYGSPGLSSAYVANGTTQLIFNAGEAPRVDAFTNAPVSIAICTLTGREISVP